jgi:hypothetical protein
MDLLLNDNQYEKLHVKDLSLSGLFTEGQFAGTLCDECDLLLNAGDSHDNTSLKLPCKLVRISNGGVALEFMYPNQDCLVFLETLILYYAADPFSVAKEFPDVTFAPASKKCA